MLCALPPSKFPICVHPQLHTHLSEGLHLSLRGPYLGCNKLAKTCETWGAPAICQQVAGKLVRALDELPQPLDKAFFNSSATG